MPNTEPESKTKSKSHRVRVGITGKVLRILPFKQAKTGDGIKKIVDLIIADEYDYERVTLWEEKAELVRNKKINVGDVLRIENAYISEQRRETGQKGVNAGKYTCINKISADRDIYALSHAKPLNLTVLAVARPEKEQVCVAGIDESGEWIRPQGIYKNDVFCVKDGEKRLNFVNLGISPIYVDAWMGRRPRKEDRFFVCGGGVKKELSQEEKREFLRRNVDASVDEVFKRGRSLGLIKPRILRVYEEKKKNKKEEGGKSKSYEQYIRFDFKDSSPRIYRRWSCRCDAFYKTWNELKERKKWTYGWRMLTYLRKNDTYLAIGLTYSDYGISKLEYGAYPMIVGVHVVPVSRS
jgi:hypothetical protein